jgi:uncharacterized sulfatase
MEEAIAQEKPFYINLWPDDVHSPYWPPADEYNEAAEQGKRGLYLAVLEEMDRQFAKLFDFIRGNPALRENTLVLICSDNGPEQGAGRAGELRGFKTHLYEGGIRSPLIVWGPGIVSEAAVGSRNTTSVMAAIDLAPSLIRLSGAEPPPNAAYDGVDMLDTLLGRSDASRDRKSFYGIENLPDLALRDGRWKFLCDYDGGRPELYDLNSDPGEKENLAEERVDKVKELTSKVLAWWGEVGK